MEIKRKIDRLNQQRVNFVEAIDCHFMEKFAGVKPLPGAYINTETPAWAIDRLSILALKIYHMRVETVREGATEAHKEQCNKKLQTLLEQRKDLSGSIDRLLKDIGSGKKFMKLYKQMKMYNDPTLNPVLYNYEKK